MPRSKIKLTNIKNQKTTNLPFGFDSPRLSKLNPIKIKQKGNNNNNNNENISCKMAVPNNNNNNNHKNKTDRQI